MQESLHLIFPMGKTLTAALGAGASAGVVSILRQQTCFKPNHQKGFVNKGWSISLILDGGIQYEDANGVQAQLGAGDTFVRRPGLFHKTRVNDIRPIDELVIYVTSPTCKVMDQLGLLDQEVLAPPVTKLRLGLLAEALQEAEKTFAMHIPQYEIFTLLFRIFSILRPPARDEQDPYGIQVARQLLINDTTATMALTDVARAVGLSDSHFRKVFKETYSLSPADFRQQARLKHGRDLLADGMRVAEVADILGYADSFSFSKSFKQFYSYSPSSVEAE